jgi:DNA-binding NtrC family response regulator
MASPHLDLAALMRLALDELLDGIPCERAFLIRAGRPSMTDAESAIAVLGARRRCEGDAQQESRAADVQGPEFAIDHALVKAAVADLRPVLVKDGLLKPGTGGRQPLRSVVGVPYGLGPAAVWFLYLDRSVGGSAFSEADLDLLKDYAWRFLPILESRALRAELEAARRGRAGARGEPPPAAGAAGDEAEAGSDDDVESPLAIPAAEGLPAYHGIVGRSIRMQKIFELVEKIKDTDFNVCILGESGTGKELLARAIHQAGKRAQAQFISENCGAISESLLESELFGYVRGAFTGADENRKGLFELAHGGTLFLDEISDMSEGMQRKLLRVLQEGVIRPIGSKKVVEVDVRVICASNRDLKALVERGAFRADLYYRLNVISVELPPLRERMDDLPYIIRAVIDGIWKEEGIRRRLSDSAMKALLSYSWPGNVRELTNVLRRAFVSGDRRLITRKEILALLTRGPARSYVGEGAEEAENQILLRIPRRGTFNEIIEECEKAILLNALKENRWNKSRVTKLLQIPRQSLYNKIAKYELKRGSPAAGTPAKD